ncbi:MAG: histidine phosphatase family protein [Egibacteraceae bacterium]
MEVVLVRHGETAWSRSGRHTGRTDIPLTDEGRRQAKLLGPRLAGRTFALVLTSPLSRAAQTCALAGLTGTACDDLLEWDYGDYEGRTTAAIRQTRPGWLLWTGGVPNGETAADVGRRADRVVERVRAVDGDVALVAHGHVLRVLAARWLGLPPEAGCHLALSPATLSILGWEHEVPAILRWNDGAHLEG